MNAAEAFLLGYLPALVRGHLAGLDLASLPKSAVVLAHLAHLRDHGPEIVSAVWQIERIFSETLGTKPPAPPLPENQGAWSQAVARAAAQNVKDDPRLASFREAGVWTGTVEVALAFHARNAEIGIDELAKRSALAVRTVAEIPPPKIACPTARAEIAAIAEALSGDVAAALVKVRAAARSLEAAAWGTPRDAIAAWQRKEMKGTELLRRLAEHGRWSVHAEGDGPKIFAFDKRVLLAWSDAELRDARPDYLRGASDRFLSMTGTALFSKVPDDAIDLVVLEGTADAKLVINYSRDKHPLLAQAASEAAFDVALSDWSALDLDVLREKRFWCLVSGDTVKNLVATDTLGHARVALFATEEALDAFLERAGPKAAEEAAKLQRVLLPGRTLFGILLAMQVPGIVLNPNGPNRSRMFNRAMLERLAPS